MPFRGNVISGMQLFVGLGKASVAARVGIESQKARGPKSIVVRVAVRNGVCGRSLCGSSVSHLRLWKLYVSAGRGVESLLFRKDRVAGPS